MKKDSCYELLLCAAAYFCIADSRMVQTFAFTNKQQSEGTYQHSIRAVWDS